MNNNKIEFPRPLPIFDSIYQSGISDPRFPLLPAIELENDKDYNLYKGLVDKQGFINVLRADIDVKSKSDLKILFKLISDMAYEEMFRKPSKNPKHTMPLDLARIPESWRVTVTVAFGNSLFEDEYGNDRYGLSHRKPKNLKLLPNFPGDEFSPKEKISDILILIASDHPYVNVGISRYFAEYTNRKFSELKQSKEIEPVFKVKSVEEGFGRPDSREFLKFNDGIDNLRANIDLEKLVYIDDYCNEPDWCIGGSYLVYKKIQENMPVWEFFSKDKAKNTKIQEGIIGRDKDTSMPLSRKKEGINSLTPVYPDPKDVKDGPLDSHIRKVQPRRPKPDLFGINDLDRRFLRRAYPFFDGVNEEGKSKNGLHFIAFMKSIQNQFEHVTNMWQMNPDFPVKGTGIDALYAKNVLKNIDGGYYFCPPARKDESDFLGSGLFHEHEPIKYKIPKRIYGYGITFIDIDETIFKTYAIVKVIKNGKIVRELDNQQFNSDTLGEGEIYDFGEFKNAEIFLSTSKPILPIISELKSILEKITANSEGSRIVFLTARSDFDNKEKFLNTFRKYGIDIDSSRMYVERSGNLTDGTVAEKKKVVVMSYISNGRYRRVRLIDDNIENLEEFLTIKNDLDETLLDLIRTNHDLNDSADPISFQAFHVNHDGEMKLFGQK